MVPALLTQIDEFPYTPSGKLDRKSFPQPSSDRPDLPTAYAGPKTDDEKTLCKIFGELLAINRVGVNDNFFEMGGNSIRAIKAVAMVNERMNIGLTAAEFYDTPSVRQILAAQEEVQKFAAKQPKQNAKANRILQTHQNVLPSSDLRLVCRAPIRSSNFGTTLFRAKNPFVSSSLKN